MSDVKDGGPAFPHQAPAILMTSVGMSLRDWFAGQALGPAISASWAGDITVDDNAKVAAVWAYRFADAMLAERAALQVAAGEAEGRKDE